MGCHQVKRASTQRGFTLIEMMMAVAVIGILALIVVPMFFRESRKVKADTEVAAMFGEMSVRQEQNKIETGSYLAVAECPTTTTPTGVAATTCATTWSPLRINPAEAIVRCKYQTFAGTGTGTNNPSGFSWTSPSTNWYYILATCDGDGQATTNATFFTSSSDTRIQKLNAGN
jgi:prepilin-type N-terminal cleavage/methylation domain-containing protein